MMDGMGTTLFDLILFTGQKSREKNNLLLEVLCVFVLYYILRNRFALFAKAVPSNFQGGFVY